ncbi:phosphatase PAP2 family protein [Paracoccaceae bacterium GXU_MW_L88]
MTFLRELDIQASLLVNDAAGHNRILDLLVGGLSGNDMFKGVVAMMLFWGLWSAARDKTGETRAGLLALAISASISVILGRVLALILPFRLRPVHADHEGFNTPYGMPETVLEGWSSLPSDHAALFYALAFGFLMIDRRAGIAALLYAVIVITLPRIYIGFHYWSDMIAGGLIGAFSAFVILPWLRDLILRHDVLRVERHHPALFYPVMFFVTYQMASLYGPAVSFLKAVARGLGA